MVNIDFFDKFNECGFIHLSQVKYFLKMNNKKGVDFTTYDKLMKYLKSELRKYNKNNAISFNDTYIKLFGSKQYSKIRKEEYNGEYINIFIYDDSGEMKQAKKINPFNKLEC